MLVRESTSLQSERRERNWKLTCPSFEPILPDKKDKLVRLVPCTVPGDPDMLRHLCM